MGNVHQPLLASRQAKESEIYLDLVEEARHGLKCR